MRLATFVFTLALASSAFAQEAIVTADAPIFVKPGATVPLRTAAAGTVLRMVAQDGEWVQVQFNDPRWGLRTGWVRAELLDVGRDERTPMDLSVTPGRVESAPASMPPQPLVQQPVGQPTFVPRARMPRRPAFRNHVVGRSGVTFGTATAALAGVEVSGDVLPVLQVYGAFDWHQDVIPKDIRNAFALLGDVLGVPLELKFPNYVGIGGVKAIAPPMAVRPYGIGGFGVAHSTGKILVDGEDQTQLVLEAAGMEKSDISYTEPIAEFGGGIVIPAGRAYLDVGYRFRKVLNLEGVNMSGVYLAAGFSY